MVTVLRTSNPFQPFFNVFNIRRAGFTMDYYIRDTIISSGTTYSDVIRLYKFFKSFPKTFYILYNDRFYNIFKNI